VAKPEGVSESDSREQRPVQTNTLCELVAPFRRVSRDDTGATASPGGAPDVAGVGTTASALSGASTPSGRPDVKARQRAAWKLAAPEAQTRPRNPADLAAAIRAAALPCPRGDQ
jgi:hypothetical protein